MSWPTGDDIPTGLVSVRFLVPYDTWILSSLTGSMLALRSVFQWDAVGEVTPPEAAALFNRIWESAAVQNTQVGQVVCFPADNMQYIGQDPANGPSQYLKCEGQTLSKLLFPDLYAVIGGTFGSDLTTFNLPDLRGRTIVDAGTGAGLTPRSLADSFGEETHVLDQAEMPDHSHSIPGTITSLAVQPGDLPVLDPSIIPGATGNTGGNGAHNNMQPTLVLFYYIQVYP